MKALKRIVPETTRYTIDPAALRAEARRLPGARAKEVRFETIAAGSLPRAFVLAGDSFEPVAMPRPVFQLVFPDGSTLLIDVAYDRATHDANFPGQPYFDSAWENLVFAMEQASQIVVTHEHSDHLGGAATHPRPERIAPRLRLTPSQADEPRAVDTRLPEALTASIELLRFEGLHAIAPGVVLQHAPGHTPGTLLIFVTLEGGEELLFVGDVVWNLDAVTELKYRPRLTTRFLDEDRGAVLDQIRALRAVHDGGEIRLVVSHDARTFEGAPFREGFALSAPAP